MLFLSFFFFKKSDTRVAERCKKNQMIYRTLLCQNKRPECVAQTCFYISKESVMLVCACKTKSVSDDVFIFETKKKFIMMTKALF